MKKHLIRCLSDQLAFSFSGLLSLNKQHSVKAQRLIMVLLFLNA